MRSRCTNFVSRRNLSNNFLSSFDSFDLISLFDSIIGKKKFGKGILNKVYHILYKIGGWNGKFLFQNFLSVYLFAEECAVFYCSEVFWTFVSWKVLTVYSLERVFIPWKRISSVHFASLKRVVEYFKRLFRGKFLRRFISWKGQNFKRLFHGERFLLHKKRTFWAYILWKTVEYFECLFP